MLTHSNGLLATARAHLCKILFGEDTDAHVLALFRRSRNKLLPSLDVCMRMTLDELKALEKNNVTVPARLTSMEAFAANPSFAQGAIINMGSGLDARAASGSPTSIGAAALLSAFDINMNNLLMPLMLEGDGDGTFVAAYLHELLMKTASGGLLQLKEADFSHLYTDGLKTMLDALCASRRDGAFPVHLHAALAKPWPHLTTVRAAHAILHILPFYSTCCHHITRSAHMVMYITLWQHSTLPS